MQSTYAKGPAARKELKFTVLTTKISGCKASASSIISKSASP